MKRRRLYFLKPIRPAAAPPPPPDPPLTPETAPDRLLWLDPAVGVTARGAVALNGSNQSLAVASAGLAPGSDAFWFGGWAWFDAVGTTLRPFLARDTPTADAQRAYSIFVSSASHARLVFSVSGNGTAVTTAESTTFGATPANAWVFVLAYRSGSTIGISVNGGPFDTASFAGPIHNSTAPFRVGAFTGGGLQMAGRADQVAFGRSPTATPEQIRDALFNGGAGVGYAQLTAAQRAAFGLVSFWELGEPSGNRLDAHGANHLAPTGTPAAIDGVVEKPARDLDAARSWTDRIASAAFVQNTISQRPRWRTEGSLDFDGVDDRLERAGPIVGNRAAFTMLARVRLTALPASDPAVIYTEADAAGGVVNRLAVNSSGNVVASYRPSGGVIASAVSAAALTPGVTHVVGVRRDGTDLRVFVDGSPSGTAAVAAPGTSLSGATARVGGPVGSGGLAFFNGRIRSIFAVGRALTDPQIAGLSANL